MLTLRAGQVVSIEGLIEELWEDDPPRSAVTTTQTYIYQLRKSFERFAANGFHDSDLLVTRQPGYSLKLSYDQLDSARFERLLDEGRMLLERAHFEEAADKLHTALALWNGQALANVTQGPLLRTYATHLEEQRITALELRIAADMRLGRHRQLIAELKSLVGAHPLNEWLHAQLIVSLSKAGRRGDALRAYQDLRRILNTELGLEPSAEVQRIHQDVLSSDIPRSPHLELLTSVTS